MGLFGGNKAKKAALTAQANTYWGELSRVVNTPRPVEVRDVEGADEYNQKVKQYNTRIDQLARQMKGQDITEVIAPLEAEYTSKVARQLEADDKARSSNPLNNMGRNNPIQNMIQKPLSYTERASQMLSGQSMRFTNNISEAATLFNNPVVKEFQDQAKGYKGLRNGRNMVPELEATFKQISTLATGLNLSGKKNKIQEQIDFKASDSGQTLAMQQKMARRRGRNSTILTGSGG